MSLPTNEFFGPIMRTVDFIVSDVQRKRRQKEEEEKRREYWAEIDKRDSKNKAFQLGLSLFKDSTPESKKVLGKDLFKGILSGEYDPNAMQNDYSPKLPEKKKTGRLSAFAARYYPGLKDKDLPLDTVRIYEDNAVSRQRSAISASKGSSGASGKKNPMVDQIDKMIASTLKFKKDSDSEEKTTLKSGGFSGNMATTTVEKKGGNSRRVATHLEKLYKLRRKVANGGTLNKEEMKWLDDNGVYKPMDDAGRASLKAIGDAAQELTNKLKSLED